MAKNKHSITLADGTVATRNSANRIYTHAIVARRHLAKARADLAGKGWRDSWASAWSHAWDCASVQPGDCYPDRRYSFTVDQDMHDKGVALLAQFPTVDMYIADCHAKALAKVNEQGLGELSDGQYVLQWSMSEANARKAVGSKAANGYYAEIRIQAVDAPA